MDAIFQLPAEHQRHDFGLARVRKAPCANDAAVSEHGRPVGNLEDLIQKVGDEDDGKAACLQLFDDGENKVDLVPVKAGGRFVQDQDPAFRLKRPRDFDKLAMSNPERAHRRGDVHIRQADCIQGLAGTPVHFLAVQKTEAVLRQLLDGDVFGDGEMFQQVEFLMNHLNAMILGVMRAHGPIRLTRQDNLPGIVGKHAGKDLDEGRFSRTVFPNERMDLAFIKGKADPVQRLDATEMLFQTLDRQESTVRCSGGRCGKRCCCHDASSRFFDE
nr:hypothetical protein [uncultured Sphingopyxis sp.]